MKMKERSIFEQKLVRIHALTSDAIDMFSTVQIAPPNLFAYIDYETACKITDVLDQLKKEVLALWNEC
jgi:hypothetical protein